ncbi:hypothetical protein ACUXV3_03865 [Roseobacteraceae bacterium NS-SX3]
MSSSGSPYFYVVMPIGSDPDHPKKLDVLARLSSSKLSAHFPTYSVREQKFDLENTLEELRAAKFVIADVSLERPSCYYELGLAHALRKRSYLVAEAATPIHQADQRESVIFYRGLAEFENAVKNVLGAE